MKIMRSTQGRVCARLTIAALIAIGVSGEAQLANATSEHQRLNEPVKEIADQRLLLDTPDGKGELPIYADHAIEAASPDVTKVLIIIHGTLRNADAYYAAGEELLAKAGDLADGTMVVAPQFLIGPDVDAFSLNAQTLAWTQNGWKGGEAARQPAPISSFAALDALLKHFADRRLYPSLKTIVVMGHSAGAQLVQRYAVAAREIEDLTSAGISVRYLVANPSSYLYFDNERPALQDQQAGLASCPKATQWRTPRKQICRAQCRLSAGAGGHESLHPFHRSLLRSSGAGTVSARARADLFRLYEKAASIRSQSEGRRGAGRGT
jgi:pimeloyl-ACP methyl ester carboxylesterase